MIEWLPWLPSKSCYTNLKFFETLKDTPNPSKGFRFLAFLVLEILGGPFRPPPPLVLGVGTKTLGARRVKPIITHDDQATKDPLGPDSQQAAGLSSHTGKTVEVKGIGEGAGE